MWEGQVVALVIPVLLVVASWTYHCITSGNTTGKKSELIT